MEEMILQDPVKECCQKIFDIPYPYPWQRLIIASVLDATLPTACIRDGEENESYSPEPLRKIAVLPTGAGKSLCWMLPAVLIPGITVAVFPLLSLMSDQKRRLASSRIPSVLLKGGQSHDERNRIWNSLESGEIRIVIANPEVLQTAEVEEHLGKLAPAFLAVDETHTVSQWGETFRPACAGLGRLVRIWKPQVVLALTATAGPLIRSRITELLFNGEKPDEALADPDRPAVHYGVVPTLSRNHSLERLVREKQRPMIIFGPTRPSVEMAARLLRYRLDDEQIRFYHAGLEPEEKSHLEEWFLKCDEGILCATCAYGMGVDKNNVRTVVHLTPPASVEAYLQETGRASRDGKGAEAWLIVTPEDALGLDDLRDGSPEYSSTCLSQPDGSVGGSDDPGIGSSEDARANRSGQAASEGDSGGPAGQAEDICSPAPPPENPRSPDGVTAALDAESIAIARRSAVFRYASSTDTCRREMLLEALGIEARDCTGCDVCGGDAWREPPEQETILKVIRWNRGRFRKGELTRILIGRKTVEIRRKGLDLTRGFGALAGWELEDAEEAISVLTRRGLLKYRRIGPKGKLDTTWFRKL